MVGQTSNHLNEEHSCEINFWLDFLAHVSTDHCTGLAFVAAAVECVLEVAHFALLSRDRRNPSSLSAVLCVSF